MKLHFRKFGEGEPLIILHGLFGSSDNWQTLAKSFSEKFTVYLVDLRNHGHSDFNDEMNYEVMKNDLFEFLQDEKINRFNLMGHSMGGKVALFFAQSFPQYIDKLIIVDMGLKKYPPHHTVIFEAMFALDLNKITSRKEAEELLKQKISDFGVLQFLLKNLYWKEPEKLAWRFNLEVLNRDIENILIGIPEGTIESETLFIRGEKSNYILDEDFDTIHEQVPNSKFVTIAGAGHWVHAEAPKLFSEAVLNFLN